MSDIEEEPTSQSDGLDDLLGYARAHASTSDTRAWVDDLERMLAIAWDMMSTEQRHQFREHADIVALMQAAGDSPLPP